MQDKKVNAICWGEMMIGYILAAAILLGTAQLLPVIINALFPGFGWWLIMLLVLGAAIVYLRICVGLLEALGAILRGDN